MATELTLEEMTEYNNELKIRLISVIEMLHNIVERPATLAKGVDRLLLKDYTIYLQIVEHLSENGKSSITTHSLLRHVLPGSNYESVECTLFNLQRLSLIELSTGATFLEISLKGSSMFTKQKKRLERESR